MLHYVHRRLVALDVRRSLRAAHEARQHPHRAQRAGEAHRSYRSPFRYGFLLIIIIISQSPLHFYAPVMRLMSPPPPFFSSYKSYRACFKGARPCRTSAASRSRGEEDAADAAADAAAAVSVDCRTLECCSIAPHPHRRVRSRSPHARPTTQANTAPLSYCTYMQNLFVN